MDYHGRVQRMFLESGYTLKEISQICEEKGLKITPSYLSKLKNGSQKPASDDVHKVLAEICNIDVNMLLFEAYYEKAPNWLKDIWDKLDLKIKNHLINEINAEDLKWKNWLYDEVFRQEKYYTLSKFLNEDINILKETTGNKEWEYIVEEDSMVPLFYPKDILVFDTQDKIKNGDLICVCTKNKEKHLGKCILEENRVILLAQNPKYPVKYIEHKDIYWKYIIKTVTRQIERRY